MPGIGVHFAIDDDVIAKLRAIQPESDRVEFVCEEIEEVYFEEFSDFVAETDKAWAEVHCVLTDGTLAFDNGAYPLNHAVLGGELLCHPDDYILSLKTPSQVADIAEALEPLTEAELKLKYLNLDPEQCGAEIDEDGWNYTWEGFDSIRKLFRRAADERRSVLFTADA